MAGAPVRPLRTEGGIGAVERTTEDEVPEPAEEPAREEGPYRDEKAVVVVVVHQVRRSPGREDVGHPGEPDDQEDRLGALRGRLAAVVPQRREHRGRRGQDQHRSQPPLPHLTYFVTVFPSWQMNSTCPIASSRCATGGLPSWQILLCRPVYP